MSHILSVPLFHTEVVGEENDVVLAILSIGATVLADDIFIGHPHKSMVCSSGGLTEKAIHLFVLHGTS